MLSRLQEERERQAQLRGPPKIDRHVAATSIQKVTTVGRTFLFQGSFCCLQYEKLGSSCRNPENKPIHIFDLHCK